MNPSSYNDKESNGNIHQCLGRGLYYESEERVKKYEVWCREHKSCNLEITS